MNLTVNIVMFRYPGRLKPMLPVDFTVAANVTNVILLKIKLT